MSTSSPIPDPPVWMKGLVDCGMPELSARDYVYCLVGDFDIDAQLAAIKGLLQRNREAEQAHAAEIQKAEEHARKLTGMWNQLGVDETMSLMHASVYQDAAHSMAAVGMLAPFFEAVFGKCFRGIGRKWPKGVAPSAAHERWQSTHSIQWDCHNVIEKGRVRTDLVKGILQLADAIGLRPRLPADIEQTLSALIGYRNKMFHCGFEWPTDERLAFQRRITDEKWPTTWFATATSGGEPWVFYMTDEFIEHCLTTADHVLTAFGEVARNELIGK
jgi:hypothetical protein